MSGEINRGLTKVLIHTDDTLLSLGARTILSACGLFQVSVNESGVSGLLPLVGQLVPNIILLDFTSEMTVGLISAVRYACPQARLMIWSQSCSEELRHQAREMGVAGFLQRELSREEIIASLLSVSAGEEMPAHPALAHSKTVSLTPRESQLVTLLAQGLKNKEIAACIGITEGTVRIYLSKLFVKIGARDRFEVAVFGLKNAFCGQAQWDGRDGFVTEKDEGRARPFLKSLVLVEPERRRGYSATAKAATA